MKKCDKQSKRVRLKKWFVNHGEEIFMITLLTGGAASGLIIGYDCGRSKGYTKGLSEFRGMHKDICNTIIDECGHQAAFEALNLVRSNPGMMKKLMSDPDAVINKVGHIYYDNDYIQKLLKSVNE